MTDHAASESGKNDSLNFEQALAQLESIVEQLQHPDLPLGQAVELYRRGTELAQESEELLRHAELQVQQLTRAVQERFQEYAAVTNGSEGEESD
jgi:exodeoxyribonuclease VII small subunit